MGEQVVSSRNLKGKGKQEDGQGARPPETGPSKISIYRRAGGFPSVPVGIVVTRAVCPVPVPAP